MNRPPSTPSGARERRVGAEDVAREYGRLLHDPRLRDLAEVRDGLAAALRGFRLGALRVPLAEFRVRVEPRELLADVRVGGAVAGLSECDEVGQSQHQVAARHWVGGCVAGAPAEHAALRPGYREAGV